MYNLWNMLAYLWYILCFKPIPVEEEEWGHFVDLDDSSLSFVSVEPMNHYRTLQGVASLLRLGRGIV